jgi:pilus assembly protein CpaF
MTAVDIVDAEVRELIRRRGVDPARDPAAVRTLIDDVLSEYEIRSLAATLPALGDRHRVARVVHDSVAGFGPLQRFLDDPQVEEIWVNGPGRVFVSRGGRSELTNTILTPAQVEDLVERMLKSSGRRVDISTPFVDATLPDGSRLHVVIPDITFRHWAVNIRKFVLRANTLDELVGLGTVTPPAAAFLDAAIRAGLNVIVSGGTQAGKTTLLNCLAAAIPGGERVITCEEVFELQVDLPDVVAMQTRQPNLEGAGEIRLRRLIKEALRMRPSRIIVGEVRQEERHGLVGYQEEGDSTVGCAEANLGCGGSAAMASGCRVPLHGVGGRVVVRRPSRGRRAGSGSQPFPRGLRRGAFVRRPRQELTGRACVSIRQLPLIARIRDRSSFSGHVSVLG